MVFASRLDEFGRPAWIAATVLGFWLFWPLGLAVLLFLAFSGRMRAWRGDRFGRWQAPSGGQGFSNQTWNCGAWGRREPSSSGNAAFDEYRRETLRRLEEEQKEFVEYLERLRQAKDKAEFDQFMADRRRPPATTDQL
jgi:hypothetical protein